MSLTPILVMDGIVLVIAALLAVAERFLVTYGECTITVSEAGEQTSFPVKGGTYLHAALKEGGVRLSTSCGGKATCGYCKVHVAAGGGPVLPTEEAFLTRGEKLAGVRLACQVKVKNDVQVMIPDFLTTVRDIVDHERFNPKLRWRFRLNGLYHDLDDRGRVGFSEEQQQLVHAILQRHGEAQASLVPMLQEINTRLRYLPESVFPLVAQRLDLPVSTVYRVATFYNAFSLKPRGRHTISVCQGTACHVKGAADILAALERELGIRAGETTGDLCFTLEPVRCIGCCGLAPVLTVDEDVHGHMTVNKVAGLLDGYREAAPHA